MGSGHYVLATQFAVALKKARDTPVFTDKPRHDSYNHDGNYKFCNRKTHDYVEHDCTNHKFCNRKTHDYVEHDCTNHDCAYQNDCNHDYYIDNDKKHHDYNHNIHHNNKCAYNRHDYNHIDHDQYNHDY
ncbi:hypothetical protein MTO96_036849 [Rhipicephalus appendiculatus]